MTVQFAPDLAVGRVGRGYFDRDRIVSFLKYRYLSRRLRVRQRPLSPSGQERLVAALAKYSSANRQVISTHRRVRRISTTMLLPERMKIAEP